MFLNNDIGYIIQSLRKKKKTYLKNFFFLGECCWLRYEKKLRVLSNNVMPALFLKENQCVTLNCSFYVRILFHNYIINKKTK